MKYKVKLYSFLVTICVLVTSLCPITARALTLSPQGFIDSPCVGATMAHTSSTSTIIHGWLLDSNGVSKVEVFVDGTKAGDAIYGAPRDDVYSAFPAYNNKNAGFTYLFNTSSLAEGKHILKVVGTSTTGTKFEIGPREFYINRTVKAYIESPKSNASYAESISVFGWFLDKYGVNKIEVLLDDKVVGTATYGISRPDVLSVYPEFNNSTGGFFLNVSTTNVMNGVHVLKIRETGKTGVVTLLDSIYFHIKHPVLGYIDTPKNDTTYSENIFINGWVLDSEGVNKIEVLLNDVMIGTAVYGDLRSDVLTAYPQYNNSNSGFHFRNSEKITSDSHQ